MKLNPKIPKKISIKKKLKSFLKHKNHFVFRKYRMSEKEISDKFYESLNNLNKN